MNFFPAVLFVFSLISGSADHGDKTSDVKGEIMGRYKNCEVEEPAAEVTCDENEYVITLATEGYS